jgi:hypothetical protein
MRAYPISTRVNTPKIDEASSLEAESEVRHRNDRGASESTRASNAGDDETNSLSV